MLDLIRKKQNSLVIKIVFWTIIAAFVGTIFLVWGKGSDGVGGGGSIAASVNGAEITYADYDASYNNIYRLYQNIYREQFTPALESQLGLKGQALQMLIEQVLLSQEADRQGINVSRKQVIEAISQIPAFQDNGVFSKDRYLAVLNYQRLSPEAFEASQEQELRIQRLRDSLQEGVTVSADDIGQEYRRQNEKVNLQFMRLAPTFFESKVVIEDEALAAFFKENAENFRLPERVALKYLQFEPQRYEQEVVLSEQDLKAYYDGHLDRYDIPEQIKASHVLIKVAEDAAAELRKQKRDLAEKVLVRIKSGEDFAQLARKYSDDPGSAVKGGNLGTFARGVMVAPFEKAAFGLATGQISELVETQFGYHIIRADEHIEAGIKPLAEVAESVKIAARKEKAIELARDKAWAAYSKHKGTADLAAAAEAANIGVKETGLFTREESIDDIGRSPEITTTAFSLAEGKLGKPVEFSGSVFLYTVMEREASRLPELKEVKASVEENFRVRESKQLAEEAADKALKALQEGEKLSKLSDSLGIRVEETGLFSRSSGAFIPRLGSSEELAEAAFNLTADSPVAATVYTIGGNFTLAAMKDSRQADMSALDDEKRSEMETALLARKKDQALQDKIQALKEEATIETFVAFDRR